MEPKLSKCDVVTQTDRFDHTDEYHSDNNDSVNRITYLSKTLEQKEDLIKLLLKEKNILECEKDLLQKEQQSAIRDKESIVVRFAIVEKKLIDFKGQLEKAEKREQNLLKECKNLNHKLKAAYNEKMHITATLDVKCQEHVQSLKDIEASKTKLYSLEDKCKWNTVKLKKEIQHKQALEKELGELRENFEKHQNLELDEQTPHKIAELKASQIMLTHVNSEQTNKIHHLQKQLEYFNNELQSIKSVLADRDQEQARICAERNKLHQENLDLQNLLDNNVRKVAELQARANDLEVLRAELSISNEAKCNLKEHLQYVQKQLTDLRDDIIKFQRRESELLGLNEQLGSLNAKLRNEISLHGSKSMVTTLEENRAYKTHYEFQLKKLQEDLETERKDRAEERLVMARHFAEKSKECDNLQQKLDQIVEDVASKKKKHVMVIKDLQREIASLRKSSLLTKKREHTTLSISEGFIDRVDDYEAKEPPASKLIERIVRLQHANNRQAEKIEFLESHSANLVGELQKKAQIVSHYMIQEQPNSISGKTNKDNIETLGSEVDRLTHRKVLSKWDNK